MAAEIRDTANRQLVAAIEVLSPTNKRSTGREEYLARRQRILLSTAHLMEIDLLRTGQRVPMQQPLPEFPYFVFLSRAESRPLTEVWPIALKEPLSTVPVPLLAGDPVGPGSQAGLARKLSQGTTAASVLGRALEPLDKGIGLIWVLVLGREWRGVRQPWTDRSTE